MSKNILEMNLIERASYVNELLKKEGDLKKVAQSLGIKYSSFCKEMRTGGYSYNQSKKQYEKTLTLDEYIKIRDYEKETSEKEDAINFLTSHLTEIKEILYVYSENLILDSKVYQPNIPTTIKSLKINEEIYKEFSNLAKSQFSQYKVSDLVSQALYDFTKKYGKPS